MAITLDNCKLRVRTQYTGDDNETHTRSVSFEGVSESATADELMAISDAVGSCLDDAVIETLRVDERLVTADS